MNTRALLLEAMLNYRTPYPAEKGFIEEFEKLLQHANAFQRDHLPGHITGSAWIVDENFSFALLTHHAKLNRWLQPGGHADGNENIIDVATREAHEETGLTSLKIARREIFDLDIHAIPERKGFPEHLHFDVRILFTASRDEKFTITEESIDLTWVPLNDLRDITKGNESILRMAEKTKLLRADQQ